MPERPAARVALAVAAALLAIFGLEAAFAPRFHIASTPAPVTTPAGHVAIAVGATSCLDHAVLPAAAAQLTIVPTTLPGQSATLRIRVTAPGYRARATVAPGYAPDRAVTAALDRRPPHEVSATVCVTNVGPETAALAQSAAPGGARLRTPAGGPPFILEATAAKPQGSLSAIGRLVSRSGAASPWRLPPAIAWLVAAAFLVALGGAARATLTGTPVAVAERAWRPQARRAAAALRTAAARAASPARERPGLAAGVAVGVIVVVGTLILRRHGLRNTLWNNDELGYVATARNLGHHLPESLWNLNYPNGTQRLNVFAIAVAESVFRGDAAFDVGRTLIALLYASAAIPLFLLGRQLGLSRPAALAGAVLGLATPWAVTATTYLADAPGAATFAWFLWATTRAVVKPGVRNDAIAIASLGLAIIGRSNFLALAPVLAVAVVLHATPRARWRAPIVAAREHPLLLAATIVGLVYVLAFGLDRLTGVYSAPFLHSKIDPSLQLTRAAHQFAPIVVGTAFLPAILAIPWIVRGLVATREPVRFAFALVALLSVGAVLVTLAYAAQDERYAMGLAPLLWIAALTAVRGPTRDRPGVGALVVGAAAVTLIVLETSLPRGVPFDIFAFPARATLADSWRPEIAKRLPDGISDGVLELIIIALVASLAVVLVRRRGRGGLTVALSAAALLQLLGTNHVLRGYDALIRSQEPTPISDRTWVDAFVPRGTDVGLWRFGSQLSSEFAFRDVTFFNASIDRVIGPFGGVSDYLQTTAVPVSLDATTGRIREPIPRLVVVAPAATVAQPRGRVVATGAYLGLQLVRLSNPPSVETLVGGTLSDALVAVGRTATITAYAPAPAQACLNVSLEAFPIMGARALGRPAAVTIAGRRIFVAPGQGGPLAPIPLHALDAGARRESVAITSTAVQVVAHRRVGVRIAAARVAPCP